METNEAETRKHKISCLTHCVFMFMTIYGSTDLCWTWPRFQFLNPLHRR
jgi:hypothetical protein